jgi:hypothetical protein
MAKAVKRNFSGSLGLGNVKFDKSGFVSDGLSAVNQAAAGVSQSLQNESRQRNELEQNYRDGIVQGKFAPGMAEDVQKGLDELSKFGNSNSNEYKTKLNQLNAKLAIDVADQQRVNTAVTNQQKVAKEDPDAKFYEQDNIYNAINSSTDAKGLKTSDDDVVGAYKSAIKNVKNIKSDAVVEDFKEKIGSYVTAWKSSTQEIDPETGLIKIKDSQGQTQKTQGFEMDIVNGVSVPKFKTNSEIPVTWVEKFYTSSKAASTLMDDYVEKNKKKYKDNPATDDVDEGVLQLKQEYLREKVLGRMIPNYSASSGSQDDIKAPPGGSGSGDGNANPLISQMSEVIQGSTNVIDDNTPLDRISLGDSDEEINVYNVSSKVDKFFFGKDEDGDPIKADNVYLSTSKTDGENTLYVEIGDEVKSFRESQFKQLMNDMSQGKMNGFDITDLQKSNLYNQNTQQYDLTRASGEGAEFIEEVSDAEILNRRKVQSLNGLNKALSSFGLGSDSVSPLDELSTSDFKSTEQSKKLSESLTSALVGKRIPTFNGGSEIVSIATDQKKFFTQTNENINIKYADGEEDTLTVNEFKARFK